MTAILLAAGVGKRMGAHAHPKSLLTVGGRSLLQRTLESLQVVDVSHLVLAVGYRKKEVTAEARRYAGAMTVTVIENPRFQEGAILSLWGARNSFDDDLLIMDADVLSPPAAFSRLTGSMHANCLLVDGTCVDTGEEQMVLGRGNRVLHITKRPSQEMKASMTVFGESVGFLKLSREAAAILRRLLEEKIQAGVVNIEHEQLYPDLFRQVVVGCERVDGMSWTEIDTPEDLERAEKEILPVWEGAGCLNRWISQQFLPVVFKLPLTPNQWTFFSFVTGLASVFFIAQGDYPSGLIGAGLFQLFYMMDNWDGDVARHRGLSSRWGGWFDVTVDGIVQTLLPVGLAAGLSRFETSGWIVPVGWIAAAGIFLDSLVAIWAKARGFGPGIYGDPSRPEGSSGWIRKNVTNENFSLLVGLVLLLDRRAPFLIATAVGSQIFWIRFVRRNRRRLWPPAATDPLGRRITTGSFKALR